MKMNFDEKKLEKKMIETTKKEMKRKVSFMRCQEHGTSPSVKFSGASLQKLNTTIKGCCDEFIKEVTKKLKS